MTKFDLDDTVETLIKRDDEISNSLGRLLATNMANEIDQYVASEMNNGVQIGVVVNALTKNFASTVCAIIAEYGEAIVDDANERFAGAVGQNVTALISGMLNSIDEQQKK